MNGINEFMMIYKVVPSWWNYVLSLTYGNLVNFGVEKVWIMWTCKAEVTVVTFLLLPLKKYRLVVMKDILHLAITFVVCNSFWCILLGFLFAQ